MHAQVGPAIASENFPWIEHIHVGPCDWLSPPIPALLTEEGTQCMEGEGAGQNVQDTLKSVSWMTEPSCSAKLSYEAGGASVG